MKPSTRITLGYFIISSIWIAGSDRFFQIIFTDQFPQISILKGWGFAIVTSVLLVNLLRHEETRRDRLEAHLHQIAVHDPLTSLLNRAFFLENIEKAIAASSRDGRKIGVVFVDLDGFKAINDEHGHDFGDKLLIEVARRISAEVREADSAARFGGDEFVILVHENLAGSTQRLAARLIEALRQPIIIQEVEILLGASIGLALYPDHGQDAKQILSAADFAMYLVKAHGKNAVQEAQPLATTQPDVETSA